MLAAITYSGLSSQRGMAEPVDLDPGFITMIAAMIRFVRDRRAFAADTRAANLIEATGGRLTDNVERRIAQSFI